MKNLLMLSVLIVAAFSAGAGQVTVPPDREALLNSEGAGMAAYAELNGFPGPKHVLDLEKQLGLTAEQKGKVREIYDDMKVRARNLGKMIVKVEEELNYAFSSGMVGVESVEDDAEQAGKLRGILRGVHLSAHLKTKELLTPDQVKAYMKIRKELREKEDRGKKGGKAGPDAGTTDHSGGHLE